MQLDKFRDEKVYQELLNPTAGGWKICKEAPRAPVLFLSSPLGIRTCYSHVCAPNLPPKQELSTGDGRGDGLPHVQAAVSGSSEPKGRVEERRGAPAPVTDQSKEMSCKFNHSLGSED